jgi:hypothetical protein
MALQGKCPGYLHRPGGWLFSLKTMLQRTRAPIELRAKEPYPTFHSGVALKAARHPCCSDGDKMLWHVNRLRGTHRIGIEVKRGDAPSVRIALADR